LTNQNGEVFSIVVPEVGNGPFAAVVDIEDLSWLFVGEDEIVIQDDGLWVGGTEISFDSAEVWEPVPDWETLISIEKHGLIEAIEDQLRSTSAKGGMVEVFYPAPKVSEEARFGVALRRGSSLILEGIAKKDEEKVSFGAAALAGLGIGLTPTGDDFLMGIIYGLWATLPREKAQKLVTLIHAGTAGLTTTLSSAWLEAARDGEAGEKWHDLASAVGANQGEDINKSIEKIIDTGETSGADALTGFVQVLKLELVG
jgi:hypothetical protein